MNLCFGVFRSGDTQSQNIRDWHLWAGSAGLFVQVCDEMRWNQFLGWWRWLKDSLIQLPMEYQADVYTSHVIEADQCTYNRWFSLGALSPTHNFLGTTWIEPKHQVDREWLELRLPIIYSFVKTSAVFVGSGSPFSFPVVLCVRS